MSTPEQAPQGPELKSPEVSGERYQELAEKLENKAERGVESGEKAAERAKVEALESAISVERAGAEKSRGPKEGPKKAIKRRGTISKLEKEASFKRHMQQVQAELPPAQRAFSKFIHAKPVEKVSEFVGATIARPNAIFLAALIGFIAVLAVYLLAKNLGYKLSGFETIGAFIIGWVIGVLYDYFKVMITGKK
jgi:hypothetical protein